MIYVLAAGVLALLILNWYDRHGLRARNKQLEIQIITLEHELDSVRQSTMLALVERSKLHRGLPIVEAVLLQEADRIQLALTKSRARKAQP